VLAILDAQTGCQSSRECRILRDSAQGCEALDFRVQCQPFPLNDESYTIFVAQDISVEKRKDVLERTFFHDLLNLAGGMQGLTALLQDEVVTFEEVKQDLFTCAHALVQEIKSQQMLLAAEQERLALNLVPLSAAEALTVVQQAYRSHPVAGDREIWLAPDTADFILTTDPAILHRILGNLTKNALEASPPGSQVRLGCRAVQSGGIFTCHNPGCMPPDVQLQMFQRSFSTKGRGRGIGTYSIKLFAEKYLQGRVSFTSTPDAGTTFTVLLPAIPASSSALTAGT
jgi:signal transduction histidine kinase